MDLKELPTRKFIRHPWEKSRLNFFMDVLSKNFPNFDHPINILDVGAGDGFFAKNIIDIFPEDAKMTCWDLNYSDDQLEKGTDRITYTRTKPEGKFDLVFLMDVIEHIENDREFLKDLADTNLNPGAFALVSVPAWQHLFMSHDTFYGHFRRYSPSQCIGALESAGLSIQKSGGLFHSLLLPRHLQKGKETFLQKIMKKEIRGEDLNNLGNWNHGKFFTGMIDLVLSIDNKFSHIFSEAKIQSPGLSFWAVAKLG